MLGLGDGGAHVDLICDAGYPSFLLSYWVRDRARGTLPLETAVKILTSEPAAMYGLRDRGAVAPGLKADLNVLDADADRAAAHRGGARPPRRRQARAATHRRVRRHHRQR